jgi:hypothetical protein
VEDLLRGLRVAELAGRDDHVDKVGQANRLDLFALGVAGPLVTIASPLMAGPATRYRRRRGRPDRHRCDVRPVPVT